MERSEPTPPADPQAPVIPDPAAAEDHPPLQEQAPPEQLAPAPEQNTTGDLERGLSNIMDRAEEDTEAKYSIPIQDGDLFT
eukprot:379973-Pyramimonas_sp.AAC.1